MLEMKRFTVNPYGENCYVVYDGETQQAVVIDDGAYSAVEKQAIYNFIQENQLAVSRQLLTHAHFDHILGVGDLYGKYGAKVEFSQNDDYLYFNLADQLQWVPWADVPVGIAPVGRYLEEDDTIEVGKYAFRVICVPGHSRGGLCYYEEKEKMLFCGDSLFQHSIGRTDLPGGSEKELLAALKGKVMVLPENVVVYPGHGPCTTIGDERQNNPFIQ